MKVAAISLLSASAAISARRTGASSENLHDDRRHEDRRRARQGSDAIRLTPINRMVTGLAVQIIAQIEKPEETDVAAARAAYRNKVSPSGEVVNYKA